VVWTSCRTLLCIFRPSPHLNEIVRGTRDVTADTALWLAQVFKAPPQFWMHMRARRRPEDGDGCASAH